MTHTKVLPWARLIQPLILVDDNLRATGDRDPDGWVDGWQHGTGDGNGDGEGRKGRSWVNGGGYGGGEYGFQEGGGYSDGY